MFDLGMAKDIFRTLRGQPESCVAASGPEEWVRAGSSPWPAPGVHSLEIVFK